MDEKKNFIGKENARSIFTWIKELLADSIPESETEDINFENEIEEGE